LALTRQVLYLTRFTASSESFNNSVEEPLSSLLLDGLHSSEKSLPIHVFAGAGSA
jgi:hypothetical protein